MRRLVAVAVACTSLGLILGFYLRGAWPAAFARGIVEPCAARNGDVNADDRIDLSDAVTILGNLFLGNPTELVPLCVHSGVNSGLPDTGQTKCYDVSGAEIPCDSATCPGQDGAHATGCPLEGRFTDTGDGTVTDNCTGLQWQKDSADVNGDGQLNGDDAVAWCDALAYCENLSFAGHDDWRLPSAVELQSIVNYVAYNAAFGPDFRALPGGHWSSTTYQAHLPTCRLCVGAWKIEFSPAAVHLGVGDKSVAYSVRAVRTAS